jgi:hypothetical protein
LYVRCRLISFYKLFDFSLTSFHATENHSNKAATGRNNPMLFIFFIILIKTSICQPEQHVTNGLSVLTNSYKITLFNLPRKKKTHIFLRAPYKNKLARLNITRRTRAAILSIKSIKIRPSGLKNSIYTPKSCESIFKLVTPILKSNLSTYRIKHEKTTVLLYLSMPTNFYIYKF